MTGARRVTRWGGREAARIRARVLRESDVCWICGQPGADSVDHVVPRSKGGGNEPSNLRPAHLFPCNRAKGDKPFAPIVRRSGSLD